MTDQHAAYTGAVLPTNYNAGLGPMFFEPYAADLTARLDASRSRNVLEVAAGTGIVTRRLLTVLSQHARLVATDLSEAMLTFARSNVAPDERLEWKTADAGSLPFADESFDTVVCQYGVMFFPDKVKALAEFRRVLSPDGTVYFNVWGSLADNPFARIAHETAASFFPSNPPQFYTIPFGLFDRAQVQRMILQAGFSALTCDVVDLPGESATADLAAQGLVYGTPLLAAIEERGGVAPEAIRKAVAARLVAEGGAAPTRLPMRALVFTAIK